MAKTTGVKSYQQKQREAMRFSAMPLMLAGDGVYRSTDNENFSLAGTPPSPIKQLIWQGLPGKYIAVTTAGLLTTIDNGATWGYIYPNAEFATTLPGGAVGYQVAFAIGPRGGENCQPNAGTFPCAAISFAAARDSFNSVALPYQFYNNEWDVGNDIYLHKAITDYDNISEGASGIELNSASIVLNIASIAATDTFVLAVFSYGDNSLPIVTDDAGINNWRHVVTKIETNFRLDVFTAKANQIAVDQTGFATITFQTVQTSILASMMDVNFVSEVIGFGTGNIPYQSGENTVMFDVEFEAEFAAWNATWGINPAGYDEVGAAGIAVVLSCIESQIDYGGFSIIDFDASGDYTSSIMEDNTRLVMMILDTPTAPTGTLVWTTLSSLYVGNVGTYYFYEAAADEADGAIFINTTYNNEFASLAIVHGTVATPIANVHFKDSGGPGGDAIVPGAGEFMVACLYTATSTNHDTSPGTDIMFATFFDRPHDFFGIGFN